MNQIGISFHLGHLLNFHNGTPLIQIPAFSPTGQCQRPLGPPSLSPFVLGIAAASVAVGPPTPTTELPLQLLARGDKVMELTILMDLAGEDVD